MSDTPPDAVTLLVYALDEMREATGLLRIADLARSSRRPWWRNVFFGVVRTRTEVGAGFAVQYLGENIDRARDHWRAALELFDELQETHQADELVRRLGEDLQGAGLNEILPKLQHRAIPHPIGHAAAHLEGVLEQIRSCDRIVVSARSLLMRQQEA